MYSSTGLSSEQITDLVARIHDLREAPASRAGRKPTLGLYKCVVVALIYLRSNRTQASIADQFHVSQKTISGVLWVLWTLLKNGISRLLSGVGSILGGRGWGFGTLTPSEVVSDCNVTRSRLSHPL